MANTAANLTGATVQFGNVNTSNVFVPDNTIEIRGTQAGRITIQSHTTNILSSSAVNISGDTSFAHNATVAGTLTVQGAATFSNGITGTISHATRLANNRNFSISGDVTASTVSFNGTNHVVLHSEVQRVRGVAFHTGSTNPSGSTRLNVNGYLYATRVYNSVWNDIADFVVLDPETPLAYGCVYTATETGYTIASAYAQRGSIGIASDTYGFGVGQKDDDTPQAPIAIGGFVLAYVDRNYPIGTALVSSRDGELTKARWYTRILHPERILATFLRKEQGTRWNGIEVSDRCWVKVV